MPLMSAPHVCPSMHPFVPLPGFFFLETAKVIGKYRLLRGGGGGKVDEEEEEDEEVREG